MVRLTRSTGIGFANDLARLLQQELRIVEQLLELVLAKREAILSKDSQQIETLVANHGRLMDQWAALEAQRHLAVVNWAKDYPGLDDATRTSPTLGDVLSALSEKEGKEIRKLADTLSEHLTKLDQVNKDNAGLLYYSLAVVQTMLGALTGHEARGEIYGPGKGNSPHDSTGKAILDWRA